jgi:hypothetical protein
MRDHLLEGCAGAGPAMRERPVGASRARGSWRWQPGGEQGANADDRDCCLFRWAGDRCMPVVTGDASTIVRWRRSFCGLVDKQIGKQAR